MVCVLREGGTESLGLDLIFDSYTEFSVEGPASVHLTGYYMTDYELGARLPPSLPPSPGLARLSNSDAGKAIVRGSALWAWDEVAERGAHQTFGAVSRCSSGRWGRRPCRGSCYAGRLGLKLGWVLWLAACRRAQRV